MQLKLRDPASALTHFVGIIGAVIGLVALLVLGGNRFPNNVALAVYGFSLIFLFTASTVYHSARTSPRILQILRKIDHSAIYVLIAGTYTPICVIAFQGFWRWGFLSIIWALALLGVMIKVFFIRSSRWLTAGVYVVMGWLCIFAIQQVLLLPPSSIAWLVTGGVVYTVGAGIYATKRLDLFPGRFGFHEVWHLFVLMGALAHFLAIMTMITAPVM